MDKNNNKIKQSAKNIKIIKFFICRRFICEGKYDFPGVHKGAFKLKEIAHIHAEGDRVEEINTTPLLCRDWQKFANHGD